MAKTGSDIGRDIIAQRVALIRREAVVARRAKAVTESVLKRWLSELTQAAQRATSSSMSEAARRAAVLVQHRRMTEAQVKAAGIVIEPVYRATYKHEAVKHTEIVSRAGAPAAKRKSAAILQASFAGINRRQVEAALSGPAIGMSSLGKRAQARAQREVTRSIAEGESWDRLAGRLIAAGLTTSRESAMVARTAVMAASNNAAVSVFQQADPVSGLRWLATFDSRTCIVCGALHGREWPKDDPDLPVMPAHPHCRCAWLPVFLDAAVNDAVSGEIADAVGELEAGTVPLASGSFEAFLRDAEPEVRADFFPSAFKRAAFEANAVSLDNLVTPDGETITDEDLAERIKSSGGGKSRLVAVTARARAILLGE